MDEKGAPPDRPDWPYAAMESSEGLEKVALYADGIGPNKAMVIPRNMLGNLAAPTRLVADAHAAGLKVHPWTFRRENYFLPLSAKSGVNPAAHGDVGAEIRAYIAAGVDGLFTDNVAEGVAVRK
jgi:glycerophosphoryl diester phosphodiesterase